LNRTLERVFETASIDPACIAIGGFSDGATYGLSLGLINGDLFSNVVAFSPGFIIGGAQTPRKPRVFVSHGTRDHILPIERCGRRVVAGLRARGYDVTFREFDGDHEIPPAIAREGLQWLAGPRLNTLRRMSDGSSGIT
jgi:predicted esterase